MTNPEMGNMEMEAKPKIYLSMDDIRRDYQWAGSAEYPKRTEAEAWPHVETYLLGNEYVTEQELVEMGFSKKEQVDSHE